MCGMALAEDIGEEDGGKIMRAKRAVRKRIHYKKTPYKRWAVAGTMRHRTGKHKLLMYITATSVFLYLFWRIFFTLPLKFGLFSLIMGLLLLFAEMASFIITLSNFRQATKYVSPECPQIPLNWYPDVDVFIATHNESTELLYKTVNACTFLEYPDRGKVHVWLCDDTNRPEMRELAESLGVGYFGLAENKHAKAGNLNNAFHQTSAPIVVTLDSDMIPSSEFLMRTVPYFFLPKMEKQEDDEWRLLDEDEIDPDYKIGFIQSPQSFYNPDLFQYNLYSEQNIPNEQDFFFVEANVAKNYDNISIYAGSNTVLSREALEAVGGFAVESITEDFLTGLMILESGYRNFAIPDQLAHGLSPDSVSALLSQRERWARGNIQVFKLIGIWFSRHLNFWQKVDLTAELCYWLAFIGRLVFIIAPILSALFNVRIVDAAVWETLCFWLPHYVLYYFCTRTFSDRTRSNHWSAVVDTIMAPYLTLPIFAEIFGIKQKKFKVTKKDKQKGVPKWRTMLYLLPHAFILVFCLISIVSILRYSIETYSIYSPIVLFWLCAGAKNLLFAIFFMGGRVNYRSSERFFIRMPISVTCYDHRYDGYTTDLSDNGIAIEFDSPINCRTDVDVDMRLETELYSSNMKCRVVSVKQQTGQNNESKWKYSFQIVEIDEENKRQYTQILYDRSHCLPKRFKANSSVFDDINTNLMRRTRRKEVNLRKLPRIYADLPFVTSEKYKGVLLDFNFEYAAIKLDKKLSPTDILTLQWPEGLELVLMPMVDNMGNIKLYRVINSEEILTQQNFDDIMAHWLELQDTQKELKPIGSGYLTESANTAG